MPVHLFTRSRTLGYIVYQPVLRMLVMPACANYVYTHTLHAPMLSPAQDIEATKKEVQDQLKVLREENDEAMFEFRANRKLGVQLRDLVAEGKVKEAQKMAEEQVGFATGSFSHMQAAQRGRGVVLLWHRAKNKRCTRQAQGVHLTGLFVGRHGQQDRADRAVLCCAVPCMCCTGGDLPDQAQH